MFRRSEAESRILILAPRGRDARLIAATLLGAGIRSEPCTDAHALLSKLEEGAAGAIIVEEALPLPALSKLTDWLNAQPPWSDFPIVILTSGGRPNLATHRWAQRLEALGNVTFLERPARPDTVRSALRAALRARLRQYEMRYRQEALAQANSDLEQFAFSASHDLREPIRSIAIYSDLIAKRYRNVVDQEGQKYLAYVTVGARRMETLVADLFAYTQASRIDEAVYGAVDPAHALEQALTNLEESIRHSGANIVRERLLPLRMQEVHIQQLFQNLVGNAIKYRSQRPPEIRIEAAAEGAFCIYSIRDNGIGVPREYREYIFEIFKRLHTNADYPGTGMGLAICRRIVERYRGQIWVEPEAAGRANFRFKIPL